MEEVVVRAVPSPRRRDVVSGPRVESLNVMSRDELVCGLGATR